MRADGRVSQQAAWYDDQPFGVSERVQVVGDKAQQVAGGKAGRVVGYDASGPKPGESFIRVLVLVDGLTPSIVALSPADLEREHVEESRVGIAKTLMVEMEQNLSSERFAQLLVWFKSDVCQQLLANPDLGRKNIKLGSITLPGFVLPEMVRLAAERESDTETR